MQISEEDSKFSAIRKLIGTLTQRSATRVSLAKDVNRLTPVSGKYLVRGLTSRRSRIS